MLLRASGAVEAEDLYKLDPAAGRSARVLARGGEKRSSRAIAKQVSAMRELLEARAAEPKVVLWPKAVSVNAVTSNSDTVNAAASRSGARNKAITRKDVPTAPRPAPHGQV